MARHARHAAQIRRAGAARTAAIRRLIEAHGEEFRGYYLEEAEKYDITVAPHTGLTVKSQKTTRLAKIIRDSGVLDGIDVPRMPTDRIPVPEAPIVTAQKLTRAEQLDQRAARIPKMPEPGLPSFPIPKPPWED